MLKSQNTFIFIYVVFIYQYWGALKMIFDKKKNLTTILLIVDSALKFSLNRAIS